jgi:hypothetical protein
VRNLLEKTITHLLNNEEEKATALFHKFMVEKARRIHESLRQNEEIDLDEGWDNEIHEEEYFDHDDLASAEDDDGVEDSGESMDDLENMNVVDDDGTGGEDVVDAGDPDVDADLDVDPNIDPAMGMEGEDTVEDKIDALTAEFDRLMGALEDSGVIDSAEVGDPEDDLGDETGEITDVEDNEFGDVDGEEPHMDAEDDNDLADRMHGDLADDEKPESETMESFDGLEEDLADITESVLSELEKIDSTNTHKEIGSGGKTITGNNKSAIESHPINKRIEGAKPVMTDGPHNDSFEREEAPTRKPVGSMVKKLRTNASRTSFSDGMSKVPPKGDASALINSNFADGEAKSRPPIDGRMKPKTN